MEEAPVTAERFNELLNGPLGHPLPIFAITRLALALRAVVDATGDAGERALEEYCRDGRISVSAGDRHGGGAARMNGIENLELYAWVGEDEFGSGEIGIKQGIVPAGCIPLVAIDRGKIECLWPQLNYQARTYGKRIRLCRFRFVEVVRETTEGGA
jgi:hypothetical protein